MRWETIAAVAISVLLFLLWLPLFLQLKQIPGPLYGGDTYYHYGHALHIHDSGNPFTNAHYLGEYEAYPWLTHMVIALLAWIAPLSFLEVFILLAPLVFTIGGFLLLYWLCKKFMSRTLSLACAMLWVSQGAIYVLPTWIASFIMAPLVIILIFFAKKPVERVIAGVVLGLACIQHLVAFIGGLIFCTLMFVANVWANRKHAFLEVKKQALHFLPIIGIGIAVGMLWLWAPLFVYHYHSLNPWQEYTMNGNVIVYVFGQLANMFLNFSSIPRTILSLLALAGFALAFFKKKPFEHLVLLTGIIGVLHPIITQPLLGTSFGYYRFPIFITLAGYLYAFHAIGCASVLIKQKNLHYYVAGGIVILSIFLTLGSISAFKQDKWGQVGMQYSPTDQAMATMFELIRNNTNPYDVFLTSHGETGFALHGTTGRKIVIMRRTHASPFVDADIRMAEAAVLLYGNDSKEQQRLLDKYDVKYFFDDYYAFSSRQNCMQYWSMFAENNDAGYVCLATSPQYEQYLRNNGITTQPVRIRLDPANLDVPLFPMLLIQPKNITLPLQQLQVMQTPTGEVFMGLYEVERAQ
ncbi:MAG: hypothetical protein V1725_04945 [archaeon]